MAVLIGKKRRVPITYRIVCDYCKIEFDFTVYTRLNKKTKYFNLHKRFCSPKCVRASFISKSKKDKQRDRVVTARELLRVLKKEKIIKK